MESILFRRAKTDRHMVVEVNNQWYCIPWYCLTDLLWGMPDSFYPCNKYEWADHPLYLTSLEMLEEGIRKDEGKFVAFKLYRPIKWEQVLIKCYWEWQCNFNV